MAGTGFEVCFYHASLNFRNSGFSPRINYGTFFRSLNTNFRPYFERNIYKM